MKKNLFASFILLLFLTPSFISCDKLDDLKDKDPYGLNELTDNSVVATGSAVEGADINVGRIVYYYIINGNACMTLKGSVDLSATALGPYTLGFVYGLNENITIESCEKKVTTKSLENNTFSIPLSDLKRGSSYYYRAFLSINGNNYYGKVKRFTVYCPGVDDYVGNYTINRLNYRAEGDKSFQEVDVTASYRITKKGKDLSVEIPIFKFDSSNKYTSFDYKTFSTTVKDGIITVSDNGTEIEIYIYHKTADSSTIITSFHTTSGGVRIGGSSTLINTQ